MSTGLLQFNASGFEESGYSLTSNTLRCYYQEINRPIDDDFRLEYGPQIPITGFHEPLTDFIFVSCTNLFGITVYSNFHAYARRKPEVRKFKVILNITQENDLNSMDKYFILLIGRYGTRGSCDWNRFHFAFKLYETNGEIV